MNKCTVYDVCPFYQIKLEFCGNEFVLFEMCWAANKA